MQRSYRALRLRTLGLRSNRARARSEPRPSRARTVPEPGPNRARVALERHPSHVRSMHPGSIFARILNPSEMLSRAVASYERYFKSSSCETKELLCRMPRNVSAGILQRTVFIEIMLMKWGNVPAARRACKFMKALGKLEKKAHRQIFRPLPTTEGIETSTGGRAAATSNPMATRTPSRQLR